MIIDGYSNHDWKQTSRINKSILEESKLLAVSVSTAPGTANEDSGASWDHDITSYDVIIQNINNIQNVNFQWPRRVEEKLEKYVSSGGGLYVLHSGNNAFFTLE